MQQNANNKQTILFMVVLSLVCAVILSLLASALSQPQETARDLYRSKQMLVAARILHPSAGFLQIQNEKGDYVPAKAEAEGKLVPISDKQIATQAQLLEVYKARFKPFLVDSQGKLHTFEELKINQDEYLRQNRKAGFYKLPYKLIYVIQSNPGSSSKEADGYIVPVNGMGLWDAIYGYLALAPDGNHVIGISWYEQKETPGLGANISEPEWQSLFPGKQIFQPSSDGTINPKTAPLGIVVVRGKVNEVLGDSPKAKSAVDGMAGATLTGNGVTLAYQDVLNAYRPFLSGLQEKSKEVKK